MAEIKLEEIVKIYPYAKKPGIFGRKKAKAERERQKSMPYTTSEGVIALQRTSFTIHDGELMVLLGPSGCGKTTILRMIAGLEDLTDGEIYFNGAPVSQIQTRDRNVAMIFQSYNLYPHLTVYDNIAFTLTNERLPREEIEEKVRSVAELLGITQHLFKRPKELSGGEKQRVAIGRALVRDPDVFLMDEPFSNLDVGLRNQMRLEIRRLHEKLGKTFVYVTHDQSEALSLGDRIAVFNYGILQQIGTPREIYGSPANLFTAGFVGVPQMNFLENVKLHRQDGRIVGRYGGYEIPLPAVTTLAPWTDANKKVTLGIRPVYLQPEEEGFHAQIESMMTTGTETQITCVVEGKEFFCVLPTENVGPDWQRGSRICLKPEEDRVFVFDPQTGKTIY